MSGGVWRNVPGFMLQGYKGKKDFKPKTSAGGCDISIPPQGVSDSDQWKARRKGDCASESSWN